MTPNGAMEPTTGDRADVFVLPNVCLLGPEYDGSLTGDAGRCCMLYAGDEVAVPGRLVEGSLDGPGCAHVNAGAAAVDARPPLA